MTQEKIIHNAFKINNMFEEELCEYTGAPYCVTVDCCTNALFLCALYLKRRIYTKLPVVEIPKQTYLSVPQAFIHAGYDIKFINKEWIGSYKIEPTNIVDSAKLLTYHMYEFTTLTCLSFHIKKSLPLGRGGAILTDNYDAYRWFKRTRYDGRNEINYHYDDIQELGYNYYMSPETAARGLNLLMNYPKHNEPQIEDPPYRDLTTFTVFKKYKKD